MLLVYIYYRIEIKFYLILYETISLAWYNTVDNETPYVIVDVIADYDYIYNVTDYEYIASGFDLKAASVTRQLVPKDPGRKSFLCHSFGGKSSWFRRRAYLSFW